jgi:hypothetical protein
MGIKDWFGGDKKKAALRDKVKEAVSDGRLDPEDLKAIEEARRELDVTPAADDKTVFRREIYNEAVQAARQDGKITATDAQELQKIQKFLGLRDDQVEKTKWDLARLRTLTEIRNGTLPMVQPTNVALRGVALENEEAVHYSISVELFNLVNTRGNDGVRMVWHGKYAEDTVGGHGLPQEGAKPIGDATLLVTNQRLVLKTADGRNASFKYGPQAHIYAYSDGIRLEKPGGNWTLRYKSRGEETGEIIATLLGMVMR